MLYCLTGNECKFCLTGSSDDVPNDAAPNRIPRLVFRVRQEEWFDWPSQSIVLIDFIRNRPSDMTPTRQPSAIYAGIIIVLLASSTMQAADENWPQFRGPDATGVSHSGSLPLTWSKTENVVWSVPTPGRGWSSPIVWGDRIVLTTVVKANGDYETAKKGLYFGGERKTSGDIHRWIVTCLDWKTGKTLWTRTAHEGVPEQSVHLKNSMASETPVTDGEHIYAYFGNAGLFCYDMEGTQLWSKRWPAYSTRLGWGTAASPVLEGERLYIVNDNEEESFLVALDKQTGDEVWRVARDEKSNWATPFVWKNELRTEIVTPGSKKVRSYDLDGQLLWELGGMSSITIPTPFAAHGLLYVTSGYVLDNRKPFFAIRPGATGDISLAKNATSNKFIAWSLPMVGPYNTSPIVYGDFLYVLYDRGLFACFDALTGKEVYGKRRLGGGAFTASPWAGNGHIYCLSEDGDTYVIPAGPEYSIAQTNRLDEFTMATPAICRENLLIRTENHLYRIADQKAGAQ